MQKLKERGLCPTPLYDTAEYFCTSITSGQISAWAKQEEQLRQALLHENVVTGLGKRKSQTGMLVAATSRAARRITLHKRGSRARYPAADQQVVATYREKRVKGLRVTAYFLRTWMKRAVLTIYGSDAGNSFKASRGWLTRFTTSRGSTT